MHKYRRAAAIFIAAALVFATLSGCAPETVNEPVSSAASSGSSDSGNEELTYYYCDIINDESVVIPVSAPDQSLYYYERLKSGESDLTWAYNEIVYAATHLANPNSEYGNVTEVYFPEDLTDEELVNVYAAVFFDHPELWFLRQPDKSGCALHPENSRLAYLTYDEDINDIPYINEEVEEAADKIIAMMADMPYEIDKISFLSGYTYDNFRIDWTSYNSHEHSSVKEMLLSKYGVCVGYASTFTYLLHRAGIFAITGHGKVSSGVDHCWTITLKDGVYVYTDNYFMRDKGGGTERSLSTYFCFDDIAVYDAEYVTVAEGVILPGSTEDNIVTAPEPVSSGSDA